MKSKTIYKINGKDIGLPTDETMIVIEYPDGPQLKCKNPYKLQDTGELRRLLTSDSIETPNQTK